MSYVIRIPDDLAAKATERAKHEGRQIDAFVQEAMEEKLARPAQSAGSLQRDYKHWHETFMTWIKSHEPLGHVADDSRESIYSGRGE